MTDIVFLSVNPKIPADVYWDMTLLKELLKDCTIHYEISNLKEAIVIIPGAKLGKHITKINSELAKLDTCKVIITSDEESKFPIDKLKHPNMEVFANYYNPKFKSKITWLPIGPASFPKLGYTEKQMNWFYAGQVNHESREKMVKELKELKSGLLVITDGFAKGKPKDEYYELTAKAKAIPAPGGHVSPDSFRFYEALEVGSIPIPDNPYYWPHLFNMPMPSVKTWKDVKKEIEYISENPEHRNQCVAWWQREKLDIKDKLLQDTGFTTVIIPTSPIKSHPSTEIIDKCIESVRYQLPNARIIITFDGVRKEDEHRRKDYEEFKARFLWKYNNQNVYPLIFKEHTHQVGMARETMKHVKTSTLVYVEGDTGFVTDKKIDWQYCKSKIEDGTSNLIRFHFENIIPEPHKHLMLKADGSLLETAQWSQRPQLTSTAYYKRILDYFSPNALTFIEDYMHGKLANDYVEQGRQGWLQHRVHIYHDEGFKYSVDFDGRDGEAKYDKDLVF